MKLIDLYEQEGNILYHGTSLVMAKAILKVGFDLNKAGEKSGYPMPGISFSADETIAYEHAEWAAEKYKGKPAVLQIRSHGLKIMSGPKLYDLDEDVNTALIACKKAGYDGAELFDPIREIGEEEFEVIIFNPKKIKNIVLIYE